LVKMSNICGAWVWAVKQVPRALLLDIGLMLSASGFAENRRPIIQHTDGVADSATVTAIPNYRL
jgi:hypothetical protein